MAEKGKMMISSLIYLLSFSPRGLKHNPFVLKGIPYSFQRKNLIKIMNKKC
jgi:hypothetical protein